MLALAACNDSPSGFVRDGGQGDRAAREASARDGGGDAALLDGQPIPDGIGKPEAAAKDGPRTDGPVTKIDGPKLVDGPVTKTDGPKLVDGPVTKTDGPVTKTDGPKLVDGPKGDKKDTSIYVDAAKDQSIYKEAGKDSPLVQPELKVPDQFVLPDKYLGDGPPPWDSIAGRTDAGKYTCKNANGQMVLCECNDGLDNDNDKKIDWPNDTGCIGPWDNSELGGSTQCSDGIDNDGDGKVDAADPECTGPLDNDESSYGTGIPGDNMDPCKQDCFFDGNSGSGDDKCEWNLKCDPANPGQYLPKPCPYDPNYKNCPTTQLQNCILKCQKITPNGCDCFGCCTITYGGVTKSVMLTPTCQPQYITDPTKCPPCTPNQACINPCGLCEVCVGKPAPDPSCFPKKDGGPTGDFKLPDGIKPPDGTKTDGGSNPYCPNNYIYCGPGGIDPNQCPPGTYCITGCCTPSDW
jgi:hypothetical protein